MIFSKIFQPKHRNDDPKIRIQAIENLTPEQLEHKTILHELAFNDGDANVNIAALEKLNSFPLWCKTAQTAKSTRVRKRAQKKVEETLFDEADLLISEKDKLTFVKECQQVPLLEKLIHQDWLQRAHQDLVISLLERIGKPNVERQLFDSTGHEGLQVRLVERMEDISSLNKALKKTNVEKVRSVIQQKLDDAKQARQKPVWLTQQVKLVLSKLLALKDKQDVTSIVEQKRELEQEFTLLSEQFDCLKPAEQENFNQRFEQINQQLELLLAKLLPIYQEELEKQQYKSESIQKIEAAKGIIEHINNTLEIDMESITLDNIEQLKDTLLPHLVALNSIKPNKLVNDPSLQRNLQNTLNELNTCQTTLVHLPELKDAIEQAKQLLSSINNQTFVEDFAQLEYAKEQVKQWRRSWEQYQQGFLSHWPKSLTDEFKKQLLPWQQGIKKLDSHIKHTTSKALSKLKTAENLIEQGKYKAAMSVFDKTSKTLSEIDLNHVPVKLQRQFDVVKQRIENLKDWQSYVAQPRKPMLLNEAQKLVEQPLEITKQAREVKRLRQAWQSFGRIDSDEDRALNEAFNIAIEQAFEPCRLHFAELETLRADNYAAKCKLLEQYEQLMVTNANVTEVIKPYNDLQQKWKAIGQVDFNLLDELNQRYRNATQPIKKAIKHYHQQNAEQKHSIIEQLEKLLESDNLDDVVEQAKQLQSRWKSVGPAGHKTEKRLWQTFRQLNDRIFAQRDELIVQQKQQKVNQQQAFETTLAKFQERLGQVTDLNALASLQSELDRELGDLTTIDEQVKGSAKRQLQSLQQSFLSVKKSLLQQQTNQQLNDVFAILSKWRDDDPLVDKDLAKLPNNWQTVFKNCTKQAVQNSRQELLIMMEILADKPGLKQEQNQRQAIKLQMMTSKLQGEQQQSLDTLLKAFVAQGPLQDDEMPYLARLKTVFKV